MKTAKNHRHACIILAQAVIYLFVFTYFLWISVFMGTSLSSMPVVQDIFFGDFFNSLLKAGVATTGMVFAVMVTCRLGIEGQCIGQKVLDRLIGAAGHTAVQPNTCLRQSLFGAAANPTANQCIHLVASQKTGQGAVAITVGVEGGCCFDFSILDVVNSKRLGMAEMLKYLPFVIGYRDSHSMFSLLYVLFPRPWQSATATAKGVIPGRALFTCG